MAEKTLFEKSLQKIQIHFLLSGLILDTTDATLIHKILSRCFYIFNFVWLNGDIVGAILWFSDGIQNGTDLAELTYLAPCTMLSLLGTCKSLLHIKYERYVNALISNLKDLERKRLQQNYEETAKTDLNFLNLVVNLLNTLNGLMVFVFAIGPLILIALHYIRTKELELILPFPDMYPFDPLDIKYWLWVYVHQIWSECIVLCDMCATDFFLFTCCTYIKIQFKLLQQEIDRVVHASAEKSYTEVRSKFVEIVIWHQELISCADQLETIYTKSILFNFLSSSIVICLTGFNVTTIDDTAFMLMFVTFLFMSLMQIFFLCLFGDLLMTSSMEISEAVYKSKWYSCDVPFGRSLLIILTRAQTPCKLTANGYADVNLTAFMRVLSSAWSYFALLRTVYGSERT